MLSQNFSSTVLSHIVLKSFQPTVTSTPWPVCISFSLTSLSRISPKSFYNQSRYQEWKEPLNIKWSKREVQDAGLNVQEHECYWKVKACIELKSVHYLTDNTFRVDFIFLTVSKTTTTCKVASEVANYITLMIFLKAFLLSQPNCFPDFYTVHGKKWRNTFGDGFSFRAISQKGLGGRWGGHCPPILRPCVMQWIHSSSWICIER